MLVVNDFSAMMNEGVIRLAMLRAHSTGLRLIPPQRKSYCLGTFSPLRVAPA